MADAPTPPPLPPVNPGKAARAPMSRAQLVSAIVAVMLSASVGVGAAFGFDVCALLASVGVQVQACPAATP